MAERIHSVLSQKRSPKAVTVAAAGSNLSGRWDVEIQFFSSKSQHTLFIEQKENWIEGSHQGDFTVRDLIGQIEGDEVRLRSSERQPGDNVTFTFAGKVSGNTISGPVYMGEYLNATFTAKRHDYPPTRPTIRIPTGPPLAT